MAVLLGFASFLALPLSPACREDALPAKDNVSRILNMTLDPQKKMLTWTYEGNVSEQECSIDTPPGSFTKQSPQVQEHNTYVCRFPNAVLHRGANLTVKAKAGGAVFQRILNFSNPGREGSGAVNFSCFIYDLRLMNCSWAPGPAAPADVRYHLYSWASRDDDGCECPHYMAGPAGTRVGCHFDELAEPHPTDEYFFLVNGTSKETDIQFLDFPPFKAVKMEQLNPPANVTVRDNGSHHVIAWDNPKMRFDVSTATLCYELDIQRTDRVLPAPWVAKKAVVLCVALEALCRRSRPARRVDSRARRYARSAPRAPSASARRVDAEKREPSPEGGSATHAGRCRSSFLSKVFQTGQERNVYALPHGAVRGERTVRVRGRSKHSSRWSAWSATLRFGHTEPEVSATAVAMVGLLVGAVVVVITLLTFLCTRWPLRRMLFPPVPQVKRELAGSFAPSPEINWDGDPRPPSFQEPEDIVTVEEMQPFASGQAEAAAPALPSPGSEDVRSERRPHDVQDF
ncbi:granulocyte-macrophage colony-stimulating factor receptor subunit alpha-like [Pteronotus mesoamericanus]|uniref:granulocyte-macrophage colony-stimulating factor receptor subunit alpha-like n=1 Tax=Pteronotus mesoamericanus TaxID=1884717 RepID=UPI0023EAF228|nr:granulocyte-macrophage colony-stimulating factor receptor subunit alpha-like [Pteronotus parnellii mesoamericanus]